MKEKKDVIRIGSGGFGSEADIFIELRTSFPGIGGEIFTQQAVTVALREEFSKAPKIGHRMFLKHAIIKKLEDFFQRENTYRFPHIPRPLGSISQIGKKPYEAYIYEWAFGSDCFPWGYHSVEKGFTLIKLIDWNEFVGAFHQVGIDLSTDCTNADDARVSQNVVHQLHGIQKEIDNLELNPIWKRIDFGSRSIRIDYQKLRQFLNTRARDLRKKLRSERYDMMVLALEYLIDSEKMDRLDIGRLDALVGNYRLASLSHHISKGGDFGEDSIARINSRKQSLD